MMWQSISLRFSLGPISVTDLCWESSPPPGGDSHTYRPYKNRLERLFGSYKAHYRRHKSFCSFEGAVAHALLYQLYYNHLKPHEASDGKVLEPLKDKHGHQVDN